MTTPSSPASCPRDSVLRPTTPGGFSRQQVVTARLRGGHTRSWRAPQRMPAAGATLRVQALMTLAIHRMAALCRAPESAATLATSLTSSAVTTAVSPSSPACPSSSTATARAKRMVQPRLRPVKRRSAPWRVSRRTALSWSCL